MTSARKIAANRLNGRKSGGPRSAAGKSIASRNALRHGLAAMIHRKAPPLQEVESFAKALCGDDDDPLLFDKALAIAQEEFVLRAITEQQLAVVGRLREPSAIALAKGDNSLKLADERFSKAKRDYDTLVALSDSLLEKYKDELPPPIVVDLPVDVFGGPISGEYPQFHLLGFLADKQEDLVANAQDQTNATVDQVEETVDQVEEEVSERDEGAALEEAAVDLVRLDRYERRAQARQDVAIRGFINRKLMKRLEAELAEKEDSHRPTSGCIEQSGNNL